ncbi:MAG: hypothetical protein M3Y13_14145, partial [Armatimonadota bacterium]|nr:hypothetical protein [Armatimonadota bacterium]
MTHTIMLGLLFLLQAAAAVVAIRMYLNYGKRWVWIGIGLVIVVLAILSGLQFLGALHPPFSHRTLWADLRTQGPTLLLSLVLVAGMGLVDSAFRLAWQNQEALK